MSFKIPEQVKQWLQKNATAAVIMSIVVALGSLFLDIRADNRVGYNDLLQQYQEDANNYRQLAEDCRQSREILQREIAKLQSRLLFVESGTADLPVPMWLKSIGTYSEPGVMLSLNPAYERIYLRPFGKSAQDYIGKTDVEMWGEELGSTYWGNDMQVIGSGEILDSIEDSPLKKPDGTPQRIRIIKYPVYVGFGSQRSIIGIGGLALPVND